MGFPSASTFLTLSIASNGSRSFTFVNMALTVSPSSRWMVAVFVSIVYVHSFRFILFEEVFSVEGSNVL